MKTITKRATEHIYLVYLLTYLFTIYFNARFLTVD